MVFARQTLFPVLKLLLLLQTIYDFIQMSSTLHRRILRKTGMYDRHERLLVSLRK